ncbi:uncharacterized protein [Pithys albifrons albifrons]|uniref:uncharacterized protein n=1 Tax=Pithys albifrons albifrons TaxID=3385563 RepID=UPI003A5D0E2F
MLSTATAHSPLRNCQPGIPWPGSLYSPITQTPSRRSGAPGLPRPPPLRRLRPLQERGGSSQNGGAHGSGSPILCPAEPVNKTPTWPRLRNRRRRLVRVMERGGRRAEDFTALPPPRGDSYRARALGEGGEGGEGEREQRASQRLPYPSAELPGCGAGEGKAQARAGGLGAALAGPCSRRCAGCEDAGAAERSPATPSTPCPAPLRAARAVPRSSDSGEPCVAYE